MFSYFFIVGFLNHQQNNHNGYIRRNGSQNCAQYKITKVLLLYWAPGGKAVMFRFSLQLWTSAVHAHIFFKQKKIGKIFLPFIRRNSLSFRAAVLKLFSHQGPPTFIYLIIFCPRVPRLIRVLLTESVAWVWYIVMYGWNYSKNK